MGSVWEFLHKLWCLFFDEKVLEHMVSEASHRTMAQVRSRFNKLVNLTSHPVVIFHYGTHDVKTTIEPSGEVFRCYGDNPVIGMVDGVDIAQEYTETITGLPKAQKGVLYIASRRAAEYAWSMGRHDVACPGVIVRNDQNTVTGCYNLFVSPQLDFYEEYQQI